MDKIDELFKVCAFLSDANLLRFRDWLRNDNTTSLETIMSVQELIKARGIE